MSRALKAAMIGSAVTTVIALIVCFALDVSFIVFVPFYMPWAVLLLIGLSNRKRKDTE